MPSWLKTLGTVGLAVGKVIPVISPFATAAGAFIPGDKDDKAIATTLTTLDHVANVVVAAERMGAAISAPGAQKLQMATPEVVSLLLQSSLLAGKHIADPVKLQSGAQKIADGMADVLNSLKGAD